MRWKRKRGREKRRIRRRTSEVLGASPLSSERRGDAELFSMFVIVTAFVILFFAWAMKITAMIA